MDLGLKGKSVIVTGGGSNIGRAIVLTFAKEGANVVNADVDEKQGQKVVDEANALRAGGRSILVKTDVTNMDSVQAMANKTIQEFGQIDVLVNVVGWIFHRLFVEKPREEWEKEINLNYWSVLNASRAVLDNMIQRKYGKIVSIGSDGGRMGEFREAVYGGAKAAVIAFSKTLAREVGRYKINVNVVCPGVVIPEKADFVSKTGMTQIEYGTLTLETMPEEMKGKMVKNYPLGRLCLPQDVANMVAFLSSDVSSFITGQTISVSGGYTMI